MKLIKTCILIPAYNPDHTLINLVKSIQNKWKSSGLKIMPEIIIVNDGSNKYESIKVLTKVSTQKNLTVFNSKVNYGKGHAIKIGLELIKKKQIDFIVTADADGQHSLIDIFKVLNTSIQKNKFIIGERNFLANKIPFKSRVGNRISSLIFFICTAKTLLDTQSGLRAFPRSQINKMLKIKGMRYEYELNVLLNFFKGKNNSTSIKTIYFDNNEKTSFRPILDSLIIYSVFVRYCLVAVSVSILDYILIYIGTQVYPSIFSFIMVRIFTSHIYFLLMKYKTFNISGNLISNLVKFYLLLFVNILASSTIFNFLYFTHDFKFIFGYISSIILMFFINFYLQKKIVFI